MIFANLEAALHTATGAKVPLAGMRGFWYLQVYVSGHEEYLLVGQRRRLARLPAVVGRPCRRVTGRQGESRALPRSGRLAEARAGLGGRT